MMTRALALLVAFAMLSPSASAEPPDSLTLYRESALSLEWFFFGGFTLKRAGEITDPGFFGGDAESVFEGSAAALEDMEAYRALRISGVVLYVAGLAMLVTNLSLIDQLAEDEGVLSPTFWGLLYGGTAAGLVGGGMVQGANGYLSSAVEHYNTELAHRLQRRASAPTLPFVLSGRF